MGIGAAKQNPVRHDDRGAAAGLEQAQVKGEEEQFGFLRLHDLEQIFGAVLVVERSGEGGVRGDEGVFFHLVGVVLREGVAVADVGVLHAMQEHVHAADAEHGVVEIEGVEKMMVEMLAKLRVAENFRVMPPEVFADRHGEAAGAAGGVAHNVHGCRPQEFHHQRDLLARGAELAILPGAGDLPEHVFVEVALGVAILHRHAVDHVHDLGEQGGRGDGEPRVLHVMRVGGVVAAEGAEEGEDVVVYHLKHLRWGEVLEARPAAVLVSALARILALGENAPLHRLLEPVRLRLLQGVQIVQPLEEKQVGDLLNDFEGVGNAAGSEGVPEGVNLAANRSGEHGECSI